MSISATKDAQFSFETASVKVTTAHNALDVTASENKTTKITTDATAGSGTLTILAGKVDFRAETLPLTTITASANTEKKIIIVTSGYAEETTLNNKSLNTLAESLIKDSEFKFQASVASADSAGTTYSTVAGTGDITLNIKTGTVTITLATE